MAFLISVPAIANKRAVLVFCRASDENRAIRLAERLIGYEVLGLTYVLTDVSDTDAELAGVREDSAQSLLTGDRYL